MKIRPLTQDDKANWLPLWQGYQTFYKTSLPDEVIENTWERLVTNQQALYGFGAWEGDKLVGIVHATLHSHSWTTQPCCYLIDLFVLPEIRGKGTGRALIEEIYKFAKEKDCNRVYWLTQESNYQGRMLYDTLANKTDFVQYRYNP